MKRERTKNIKIMMLLLYVLFICFLYTGCAKEKNASENESETYKEYKDMGYFSLEIKSDNSAVFYFLIDGINEEQGILSAGTEMKGIYGLPRNNKEDFSFEFHLDEDGIVNTLGKKENGTCIFDWDASPFVEGTFCLSDNVEEPTRLIFNIITTDGEKTLTYDVVE